MAASNEAMRKLCELLAAEIGAGAEFEVDLGELVGRYRRAHDQQVRDAEAARLLPRLGATETASVQHCVRSTVYRRVSRAAKVARQFLDATKT